MLGGLLGAWLLGREATLRWVAQVASNQSDGRILIEGVHGSLYGPWQAARIVVDAPGARVTATDVVVRWNLGALRERTLAIDTLAARQLQIEQTPTRQPAPAGQGDGLPVTLKLERAELADVRVDWGGRRYALQAVTLQAEAGKERVALVADASGGALSVNAELALSGRRAFALTARLDALDLARITDVPPSRLSGRLAMQGVLLPEWQASIDLDIPGGEFNGEHVQARGHARVSAWRVQKLQLDGMLGGNTIEARGAFGGRGDRLDWRVDLPRLRQLGPGFDGSLRASGSAHGTPAQPGVRFTVRARKLRLFGEHYVEQANADGAIEAGPDTPFSLAVALRGYRSGDIRVTTGDLQARGKRAKHELRLALSLPNQTLDASAQGGWGTDRWVGRLTRLDARGRYAAHLRAPASVELGKSVLRLRNAELATLGGTATIARLEREGAEWRGEGAVKNLSLAALQEFVERPVPMQSTLRLGGEWQFAIDRTIDGRLRVWRESGDVTLALEPPRRLGLQKLALDVSIVKGVARGELELAGTRAGSAHARGETLLVQQDGRWGLRRDAPFSLDVNAHWPSIAWMAAFTPATRFDGELAVDLHGSGSLASPSWRGDVTGRNLSLGLPEQGLDLRDGVVDAALRDDELTLKRFQFHGPEGVLDGSGSLSLAQERGRLNFSADNLLVSRLPRREVVASGNGALTLRDKRLAVKADVLINRGLIELPKHDAPTLSEDVIVVGDENGEAGAKRARVPFAPEVQIKVGLGEKFYLKGRGLDARLVGEFELRSGEQPGLLLATGQIRVAEGSYAAYGQRLAIERGVLAFSGPVDNPGLDVLALRKNQKVQAGVGIAGTVQQPVVRLVSIPEVPDTEKLSWLVLGHGLENTTGEEFDLMSAAAGALLSRGESVSLQARIAQRAGLDEFRVTGSGELETAVVRVGKRLSSDLYLSYERSLVGTGNLFRIRYDLSQRWAVQTETSTDKSAVDLLFTLPFD